MKILILLLSIAVTSNSFISCTNNAEAKVMRENISFYEAPLVCHAAPSIGCGSKAKFMLVDLEKNKEAVEGAWLNKKGTIVAVK